MFARNAVGESGSTRLLRFPLDSCGTIMVISGEWFGIGNKQPGYGSGRCLGEVEAIGVAGRGWKSAMARMHLRKVHLKARGEGRVGEVNRDQAVVSGVIGKGDSAF